MFKILDGREEFYQWDVDRKLIISDTTVDEVHFCNRTDDCSLVVEVYELDGQRVADVPNILLQTDWPIRAYAYCGGCYTKQMATYKVRSRTKPSDYVYTETEIKNYDAVIAQVEELEAIAKGRSKGYVFDTLEDLDNWLANVDNVAKLVLGDNLYVRAIDTPDYWWDGEAKQELETQKVELSDYVKNTDYATTDKSGVVKVRSTYGTGVIESNGQLFIVAAEEGAIDAKSNRYKPITPAYLDYAVKSVGDGYYATEAQLAEVDGVKEVYVGGETPPEGVGLIWIDSSKTAPDYATKEYVDNVVAAIGGGSGGGKDWHWVTHSDIQNIQVPECSHIRVMGYWDGDTNKVSNYDISTTNGNWFVSEYGSNYFVNEQYKVEDFSGNRTLFYFKNNGGYLEFKNYNDEFYADAYGFTMLGYYYWG